jgi:hydroxyacylglutathione hydrolase
VLVEQLVVGELSTNCYLVICEETRRAAVIDPGGEASRVLDAVDRAGVTVEYVITTHAHLDHILACSEVSAATGAQIVIHSDEVPLLESDPTGMADWYGIALPVCEPSLTVREGDEIAVGNITFRVLHTPGHTPGHLCLATDGVVFVGDVLFFQGIGRTDLPGGSYPKLMETIRDCLLTLDDSTVVYPGHGPATTIGDERRLNPWL